MSPLGRALTLSPPKIAGGYLVFGGLWILLSDRLVAQVAETQLVATRLQTVKGWLFVLGSAAVILALTRTREHQLETSRDRLATATQELQVLHRIFRHNIRNDLNVIQGHVELVRETLTADDERDQLGTASRTADRIVDMSEKLRVIEQADLRSAVDDSVELVPLVEQECARVESAHPGATIETDLPDEASVRGDQSLAYVVREVLENAVEHHPGPPDEVRIGVAMDQSRTTATVTIADNGPGIPEAELGVLRAGEERPLAHVSGVGLWLVTWLCQLYGGEARFDPAPDGGTVVSLTFERVGPFEQFLEQAQDGMLATAD